MKVLIISQYFWPENFRINDIAKSLIEEGQYVEVLTGKPNYPYGKIFDGYKAWGCKTESHEGIAIHRVPLIARGKGAVLLTVNYLSFIIFGLLLGPWILRKKKFDIIFVYGVSPILQAIPAIFIGKIKKTPVILWVQDLWPESLSATNYVNNKYVLKCVEYLVRLIYRNVDLLLVQSEAFIQPVSELASGTPVKYYPNSVDKSFSKVSNDTTPHVPGLEGNFSILFAGNIGAAQAVEVIVESAEILNASHPDIQFVVLGDGSKRQWMLEEVKSRDLNNLHLPGRFPIETMPSFLQKASALLVSLTDKKIFAQTVPSKIQAYMATGRPILASMNGEGARLISENGMGIASPAGDAKSLVDSILKLYNMSETDRNEMGGRGQEYYRLNYDHDKLLKELILEFETISR